VTGFHHLHAQTLHRSVRADPRLGGFRCQLGQQLGRGDADGGAEALLLANRCADRCRDRWPLAVEQASSRDVEERLVEGDRLDPRRVALEDGHDPRRHLAVVGVVAGQEHCMRAQPPGADRRHGGVDAVAPRFVAGGRHDASFTRAADDHRLTGQLGTSQHLDSREEGVHVDVQDRPRPGGHRRVTTTVAGSAPATSNA
jgi:hypothetical protein